MTDDGFLTNNLIIGVCGRNSAALEVRFLRKREDEEEQ